MPDKGCVWSTQDEIGFLKGLGGWRNPGIPDSGGHIARGDSIEFKKMDKDRRMKLLANYKTSIKNRKDWGNIVVGEVLNYIKTQLISE